MHCVPSSSVVDRDGFRRTLEAFTLEALAFTWVCVVNEESNGDLNKVSFPWSPLQSVFDCGHVQIAYYGC